MSTISKRPFLTLLLISQTGLTVLGGELAVTNAPAPRSAATISRISTRIDDYRAMLAAIEIEEVEHWGTIFSSNRAPAIQAAAKEIAIDANVVRKAKSIDATQLKQDVQFRTLLAKRTQSLVEASVVKTELEQWAAGVERRTRVQMVECFQQIIAEDLGQSFDEKLKGQVISAVKAIPLDQLAKDIKNSGKIEQAIIASLPEAIIPEATRNKISTASILLAQVAGYAAAVQFGAPESASLAATTAGEVAGILVNEGLIEIVEANTPKPDPEAIAKSMEFALSDWNRQHMAPRLGAILAKFHDQVAESIEKKARTEILPSLR